MTNAEIVNLTHDHLVNVYGCTPIAFSRGQGSYLYDADGQRYLDLFCGLAVTSLGHAHPGVIRAIKEQADKLTHVSNVFHTEPTARLAQRLGECFGGKVFFGNSGAEANEAAIKLARRWGHEHAGGRFEVISTLGSFHGRTLATLTATGQEKYHNGFFPLMPGFKLVPFNDLAAAERAIGGDSVAVMVEPIQGEGGVVVPATDYLRRLRDVCDRHNLLLIVDEIQVGIGRTGKFFAYQHAGIRPDIVTLAKALGGGIPIGAMLAKPEVAASFTPGSHGTTFGGNPVACAAALAVLDALEKENVIANAASMGQYLIDQLSAIAKSSEKISDVRGVGMIIGIVVKGEAKPIVDACLAEKLIVNGTAGNIVRLLPPLNLSRADADAALAILRRVLTS